MSYFSKKQKLSNQYDNSTRSNLNVFVRNFEHVDGNWPSHVYMNILKEKGNSGFFRIKGLCTSHFMQSHVGDSSVDHPVVEEPNPHVSLSRPFVLRRHQIEAFIRQLQDKVHYFRRFSCHVFSEYQELVNDASTRGFVCIPLADSQGLLLQLVRQVDTVLAAFKQPEYYKDPIFHVSVASRPHASSSAAPAEISTAVIRVHRLFNGPNHNEISDSFDSDSDNDSDDGFSGGKGTHPEKLPSSGDLTACPNTVSAAAGLFSEVRSTDPPAEQLLISCAAEDCMGSVVHLHSIDCKIGNRHFRLMLAPEGGDRSGLPTGNSFCEIFPLPATTAGSEGHHGKG